MMIEVKKKCKSCWVIEDVIDDVVNVFVVVVVWEVKECVDVV